MREYEGGLLLNICVPVEALKFELPFETEGILSKAVMNIANNFDNDIQKSLGKYKTELYKVFYLSPIISMMVESDMALDNACFFAYLHRNSFNEKDIVKSVDIHECIDNILQVDENNKTYLRCEIILTNQMTNSSDILERVMKISDLQEIKTLLKNKFEELEELADMEDLSINLRDIEINISQMCFYFILENIISFAIQDSIDNNITFNMALEKLDNDDENYVIEQVEYFISNLEF